MELDTGMVESVSDPFNPIVHSIEEVDKHDVNMVAEYADEIIEYMRELEIRMMPDPCYIDRQPELKWHMRGILLDWLVQVHDRFKMHQETLFLCVNYIDRFLSVKEISIDKLQLVGITALFIAAKYEEISAPTISEMIFMVDGAFSVDDLKKAERYMMNILNYELGYPDPLSFLRRISKADRYDTAIRTLAKYLSEVTLMYETFIQYPSSKIAAASYYLAMGLINKGSWTSSHIHYSGYTEMDLMPCALQLRSRLPHKQNHEAVYIKYNSEKYMNASIFVEDVFANCI
ncbi:B-type cyclin [Basidiobolus ranarum]|uniref:B-type cyclin n=1 Tax=Basidiobolus ranarum TaxID=34480 RepID=A0ABR2VM73_9FUNG